MDRLIQQTIAELMAIYASADDLSRKRIERIILTLKQINTYDLEVPLNHLKNNTPKT